MQDSCISTYSLKPGMTDTQIVHFGLAAVSTSRTLRLGLVLSNGICMSFVEALGNVVP